MRSTSFPTFPGANGSPRVLYTGFKGVRAQPSVIDAAGNLYGTTFNPGGPPNCGIVFELSPNNQGEWTERMLHEFPCRDGVAELTRLVADSQGNLYGSAAVGSLVYELSPAVGGQWNYAVISTCGGRGCGSVLSPFDGKGNLLGANDGVYQLSPTPGGTWTYTVLHTFTPSRDGTFPAGLTVDGAGNIYGANNQFGPNDTGTIFELSPNLQGGWDFSVILAFQDLTSEDGADPLGILAVSPSAGLVGTTTSGGSSGLGVVFELKRGSDGSWTEHVLHNFSGPPGDGEDPSALVRGIGGNLFGTAMGGPNQCQFSSCGIVFGVGR
jgi:uncharacterized repeat protein (TIGR03803 family)